MAAREQPIDLPNIRIGFRCNERWEDMAGDDRVRACGGCDRLVFNLSAMTRAEAQAVLGTHGVTPCVRFYRRPDGTVMTTDCPTGAPRGRRHLTVLASSAAAGATLLATPMAMAEPLPPPPPESRPIETAPEDSGAPAIDTEPTRQIITIDRDYIQGIPVPGRTFDSSLAEMGVMIVTEEPRPAIEWSLWGRLGVGGASQQPTAAARTLTPDEMGSSESAWEAAAGADATVGAARDGDLRFGVWGEVRTSSDPVAGAELVLAGLPPHPYDSRIRGTGSVVLRAGANARIVTGALGFGYVGSFRRTDPLVSWARHMVGARIVLSVNRSIDEPRDWSAVVGLELDPIGAIRALRDLATR